MIQSSHHDPNRYQIVNAENTISVIGAGSWGTALAMLLAKNGHKVLLWGRNKQKMLAMQEAGENSFFLPGIAFPDNLQLSSDLQQAVTQSQDLLLVIPSHAFRDTLNKIHAISSDIQNISWATKGLEAETSQLLHQVIAEVLGDVPNQAVISGPTFAKEVALGLPTAVTVAANNRPYSEHLASLLCNKTFRPYLSDDIPGLEVGGAVKNVMAIAAGIADGLGFGANTRAALITRALNEIARLSSKLGGQQKTLMGLSGLGDLLLTCTDNQSRNRRMGLAIGKGQNIEQAQEEIQQVVEGLQTARLVYALASTLNVEMPIVEQVYKVLYHNMTPRQAVHNLLSRDYKTE